MYRQQGCGHYRALQGGTARTFHAHKGGIRVCPFDMGESGQGAAELQHRAQAGLLRGGELQAGHLQGRPQFPEPQFRAAFQRASLLAAHLLPVPDQDHEGAQPHDQQFQRPDTGIHHPQGDAGQGNRHPFFGKLRAVRAYRERQRPAPHHAPDG